MPSHPCEQKEAIAEIQKRLGHGDVDLATMALTLNRVEQQTTKTNGRVTRLELLKTALFWLIIGVAITSSGSLPDIIKLIVGFLK